MRIVEAIRTTASRPTVILLSTGGVNQTHCRVASQARVPLAPAVAPIAPIMHCTHIA